MPKITIDDLNAVKSIRDVENEVLARVVDATKEGRLGIGKFLYRYTSWNGLFGSGVATLAGKVGRCRHMFLDPEHHIEALADRSVYVASYFFDAARDEFDDRDTEHRDTHRCLAQAVLAGVCNFYFADVMDTKDDLFNLGAESNFLNDMLFQDPLWLQGLNDRVAIGYGAGSPDDRASVFRAIGYHLGSEVLADREFSIIDSVLREKVPDLVEYLKSNTFEIAGQQHNCYTWISIHSGHGGGVEAEHFEYAMQGARLALQYTPKKLRDELRHQMLLGYRDFASDHAEFFQQVNR